MITEDFQINIKINGQTQEDVDKVKEGIKKVLETYLGQKGKEEKNEDK